MTDTMTSRNIDLSSWDTLYKMSNIEQGRIIGWKESAAGMQAEDPHDNSVLRRVQLLCSENLQLTTADITNRHKSKMVNQFLHNSCRNIRPERTRHINECTMMTQSMTLAFNYTFFF